MPTLYMMMGIPGSGKSTYAKENFPDEIYVSRDVIRYSLLKRGDAYFSKEKETFELYANTIASCLAKYGAAVADATHLNPASRKKLIKAVSCKIKNFDVIIIWVNTAPTECMRRNAGREGRARVPDDQLINMYNALVAPKKTEDRRISDIWIFED